MTLRLTRMKSTTRGLRDRPHATATGMGYRQRDFDHTTQANGDATECNGVCLVFTGRVQPWRTVLLDACAAGSFVSKTFRMRCRQGFPHGKPQHVFAIPLGYLERHLDRFGQVHALSERVMPYPA